MAAVREKPVSISMSTISSLLILIPVLWFIGRPIIVDALAEDIAKVAQDQAEPIKNAFSVLLTLDINNLRKEIAALKFRQTQTEDWTAEDAAYLASLEIELEALKDAKVELAKKADVE